MISGQLYDCLAWSKTTSRLKWSHGVLAADGIAYKSEHAAHFGGFDGVRLFEERLLRLRADRHRSCSFYRRRVAAHEWPLVRRVNIAMNRQSV